MLCKGEGFLPGATHESDMQEWKVCTVRKAKAVPLGMGRDLECQASREDLPEALRSSDRHECQLQLRQPAEAETQGAPCPWEIYGGSRGEQNEM